MNGVMVLGRVQKKILKKLNHLFLNVFYKNRGGKSYKYICLALGSWKPLHIYNWEKTNGKIPKGHCLWFKNGDTMNCELSNLELITRAENMNRNSGAIHLSDRMVATYLTVNSKKVDYELKSELLKHEDLIQAKRNELLLNRKLKKLKNGKK